MIIATRDLVLRDQTRAINIPVRIHAPENAKGDWICRFDIGWPEGRVERWGTGVDAVQALLFAMQMIGAEVRAQIRTPGVAGSWSRLRLPGAEHDRRFAGGRRQAVFLAIPFGLRC